MSPKNGRSPTVDRNGRASGDDATAAKRNVSPDKAPAEKFKRPPQVRCEACSKAFDKRAGRRKRFSTDACRMAAQRAKTESSVAFGNALNSLYGSIGCEAISPDPYPSRFSVPLDLLGAGHRWPGTPKLDREMWERILRREGCAK